MIQRTPLPDHLPLCLFGLGAGAIGLVLLIIVVLFAKRIRSDLKQLKEQSRTDPTGRATSTTIQVPPTVRARLEPCRLPAYSPLASDVRTVCSHSRHQAKMLQAARRPVEANPLLSGSPVLLSSRKSRLDPLTCPRRNPSRLRGESQASGTCFSTSPNLDGRAQVT